MAFVHRARRNTDIPCQQGLAELTSIGPGTYTHELTQQASTASLTRSGTAASIASSSSSSVSSSASQSRASTAPARDQGATRRAQTAPFLTSAHRDVSDRHPRRRRIDTPGPGEYCPPSLIAHPVSATPAVATFLSGVPRFVTREDDQPGPGAYKTIRIWTSAKPQSHSSSNSHNTHQRMQSPTRLARSSSSPNGAAETASPLSPIAHTISPSPPSIPAAHQSYGYEERPDHTLVMMRNPNVRDDLPGPGAYDANVAYTLDPLDHGAVSYDKNKQERAMNRPERQTTPGPGSYAVTAEELAAAHFHMHTLASVVNTSQFASNTKRWALAGGPNVGSAGIGVTEDHIPQVTPGPGTYDVVLPPAMRSASSLPNLHFGCNAIRDTELAKRQLVPGPGSYAVLPTFYSMDSRPSSTFATTSHRFPSSSTTVPGPGAYVDPVQIAYELRKHSYGRNASFGMTDVRFAAHDNFLNPPVPEADRSQVARKGKIPGPGTYNVQHKTQRLKYPQSAFASHTQRFEQHRKQAPLPPEFEEGDQSGSVTASSHSRAPSTADSSASRPMHRSRPSSSFLPSGPRYEFTKTAAGADVGPGKYDPEKGLQEGVARRHSLVKDRLGGAQVRWAPGSKEPKPGPGTYQDVGPEPLIKKSHNITIA